MKQIKIILVDDHSIVRGGIRSLIENESFIDVIGEAESGDDLFDQLKNKQPDIIILDISMPGKSGIDVTRILQNDYPDIKVLVLSMYTNEDFIYNSIKAGAKGYLPKNTTKNELLKAIQVIIKGGDYYSDDVSKIMLNSYLQKAKKEESDKKPGVDILTNRETEILKLVAEGKSNQQIADQLFISTRTVESHKTHILQKLEINNTVDMVKFALKHKLIDLNDE